MMRLMDEHEVIQRRAGIVWKNLKVCGSGSAINLQKNVGSLLLAPLRFGEFFGRGPEKTILNEFDGVLKSGEMLVVLGRPGSGCSTLLKSLMGELSGLDMKSQSEIHYNGIMPLSPFQRLNTTRTITGQVTDKKQALPKSKC
jgi:ABC-type multidrug transport system ATPase subunit